VEDFRMQSKGNGEILDRAGKWFRDLEKALLDLTAKQSEIFTEMETLALEYSKEFKGWPLVHYPKKRKKQPHLCALYWGAFCRPPKEESRLYGALKEERWKTHIAGGLTHSLIFQSGSDIQQKPAYLEMGRRGAALNEGFHAVTRAIQAHWATLEARRLRRRWESGDLDAETPEVSRELPPQSQSALGAAWFMLLRMASAERELRSLAERYRAEPAYPHLKLTFTSDPDHSYGRLSWRYYGQPLCSRENGKPQENLTDQWMRKWKIPLESRRLLAPHERARRRMVRIFATYTKILDRLKSRARRAISRAGKMIDLSRPQALDPAVVVLGHPPLAL
jgi:hypothetical protein